MDIYLTMAVSSQKALTTLVSALIQILFPNLVSRAFSLAFPTPPPSQGKGSGNEVVYFLLALYQYQIYVNGSIFVCGPLHYFVKTVQYFGGCMMVFSDPICWSFVTWFGHDFSGRNSFRLSAVSLSRQQHDILGFPVVFRHAFCV